MILFEATDCLLRVSGARIERDTLLLGLPPLEANDFRLASQAKRVLAKPRELRVVTDNLLFLPMLLRRQRSNRGGRFRDPHIESGNRVNQPRQRRAIERDPLAQFLDLALGGENAARFGLRAARYQVRSPEHVAADGRDRRRRFTRQCDRVLEGLCHVRFGDHLLDRCRMRADDAEHVADGDDARHA